MEAKAWNEAGRALVLWGALQVDLDAPLARRGGAPEADDLLGLLTPVIKGYLTDKGFAGRGQRAAGVRRPRLHPRARDGAVRPRRPHHPDLRRHQRHPGDGPRRPQAAQGRRPGGPRFLRARRRRHCRGQGGGRSSRRRCRARAGACSDLQAATMWLAQNGMADPDNAGAGAYAYMDLMGLVVARLDVAEDGRGGAARARRGRRGSRRSTKPSSSPPASTPRASCLLSTSLRRKIEAGAERLMAIPVEAF